MQRSVLELGQGQPEQARATVLAALGVIDTGPVHPQERAWDLVVGGGVALCAGDAALARALLSEAAELMLEVGHRLQVADALAALGLARLAEGGDPATAARLLGASGDVRGRSGCVLQGRHLRARLADDERRYNAVLASSDRLAGALAASSADGLKRLLKQACNS